MKELQEMQEVVRLTLLYDFYGELLTAHQREVFEAVVLEDQGFAEVAAQKGISRQGVHDLIRRCTSLLNEYEVSLHLVEKFLTIKDQVQLIRQEAGEAKDSGRSADTELILKLADRILEEL